MPAIYSCISAAVEQGTLKVGTALNLQVDHARRSAIRQNHSATHLLHEALRQVLGDHVAQKGSLVAPDRLRFDFSHPKPMSADEIERVEDIANDIVLQNAPVMTRLLSRDDAIASGARALFGEKYGDEVRVVAMGEMATGGGNTMGWSVELCGGTHVNRTGDIGIISVIGEAAVAAGVRRIEALTAQAARANANNLARLAKATASELRVPIDEMPARVAALLDERKRLERELSEAKKKLAMGGGGKADGADGVRVVGDVKLMARAVEGIDLKDLRSLADEGKKKVGSGVVAIVGVTERRQGRHRRRRHQRSCRALQRRRSRAQRCRGARRQGRRRPAGHGAGRRSRRIKGGCGAGGDRSGAGRVTFIFCLKPRSAPELKLDNHAVLGGFERKLGAVRQHVVAHVREDQALWPDLAEVPFERRQRHVRGDRLIARVGLADEEIRLVPDIDDRVGPFGVAGESDHLAFGFEAKSEARSGAVVVHDVKRRDPQRAHLGALADLQLSQAQRELQIQILGAGKAGLHDAGDSAILDWAARRSVSARLRLST